MTRPPLSRMSKSPTVRYNAASARDAPPNLWTSHGLGLSLGFVTLSGQISDIGVVVFGGLLKETGSGLSRALLDGWATKVALFHDDVAEVTALFWLDGMKAATLTKGAARKMDLWICIVF